MVSTHKISAAFPVFFVRGFVEKINKKNMSTKITVAFTNEARWFYRFFQQVFQTYLPNFVIIPADPQKPPHLLIFSIFGPDYKQFARSHTKFILVCGEPADLSKYTFCSLIIDCKNVPSLRPQHVPFVYLPFYITSFGERYINKFDELLLDHPNTQKIESKPKTKFCAFMYSQEIEFRNTLFDMLTTYKKVDALGKCRHNADGNIDRHVYEVGNKTYNDLAVEKYKPYKFVLAIENSRHPGYITEKIINPMLAGAIPIYYGAPDVIQHFNPKSFIRIDDFASFEDAIQYIKQVDQSQELYDAYLKEPWFSTPNDTVKSLFQGRSIVDLLSRISTSNIHRPHPHSNIHQNAHQNRQQSGHVTRQSPANFFFRQRNNYQMMRPFTQFRSRMKMVVINRNNIGFQKQLSVRNRSLSTLWRSASLLPSKFTKRMTTNHRQRKGI